jgi:hypothetical protein
MGKKFLSKEREEEELEQRSTVKGCKGCSKGRYRSGVGKLV